MKKIMTSGLFIVLSLYVLGQFSTQTELKYLQHINQQGDPDLIEDNLRNARRHLPLVLIHPTDTGIAFLGALSDSYLSLGQYQKAFYYLLLKNSIRQQADLPADQVMAFRRAGLMAQLTDSLVLLYENKAHQIQTSKCLLAEKLWMVVRMGVDLQNESLNDEIRLTGSVAASLSPKAPSWFGDWLVLAGAGIHPEKAKQWIDFQNERTQPLYQRIEGENRCRIYRKLICYYLKQKQDCQAKEILKYCEEQLPRITHLPLHIWQKRIHCAEISQNR